MDDIKDYAMILHEHGADSEAARAFKDRNGNDPVLIRRCSVLDRLFELRDEAREEARRQLPPALP